MTINERIFTELKKRNIDQKIFAEYIGEKEGTVSAWKNKETLAKTANRLFKILDFFKWSLDYLVTGEEKSSSLEPLSEEEQKILKYLNELSPQKQKQLIEIIEEFIEACVKQTQTPHNITQITRIRLPIAKEAAGAGISTPFSIDDSFEIREFNYDDVPNSANYGVPINGVSMEPDYPDGCIVWVNHKCEVQYGDVVIVIINGEPFCKIYEYDGYYSINEEAGFPPQKPTDGDKVYIFGKVIGVYDKNCEN